MIKQFMSIFLIFSILVSLCASQTVYPISTAVSDDSNYTKGVFKAVVGEGNFYLKYSFSTTPTSRIGAFRVSFNSFPEGSSNPEILCTFVAESASDSDIITELNKITADTSACIGDYHDYEIGVYDGIFEYDQSKKKFVILIKTTGELDSETEVYVRNKDTLLEVKEQNVNDYSKYSIIPYVVQISKFRPSASKILFFSKTRDMQMYYVEGNKPYPERLFFGNIMSVYTNPNMVRQKYKNADMMVLLSRPFAKAIPTGERLQYQVKFFASDYLLDYYMGTNLNGREKNSPLAINMTVCDEPYIVILNYNKPEKKVSLYIDQIYGKINSISVATSFTSNTWDDMLSKDLKEIDLTLRKYELEANAQTHMDVYKVQCKVPSLLNFYYVDESAKIPELNYGQVVISTLKANKVISLPFNTNVQSPQLTIEVFNPITSPFILLNDGVNEYYVSKNSLIKTSPMNTQNALVIKERGGDANTRIIVKVGYKTIASPDWEKISNYVIYNKDENMYVFSFPVGAKKYNYTYALLETSGTNDEDNVKYCYGTNIGSAILPSSENCYRVSKDNNYVIKIMNPAIMYKDYDLDENLIYYVSLKPTNVKDQFTIKETVVEYSAKTRNFEAQANVVELTDEKESSILGYPQNNDENIFYQIQSCAGNKISYGIFNAYDSTQQIVPDTDIEAGKKNYNAKFENIFGETELKLTGTKGDKIFVKHSGVTKAYQPQIKASSYNLKFDDTKNAIISTRPLENSERLTYTIYVTPEGGLTSKQLTICSFVNQKESIATYIKSYSTYSNEYELPINFKKLGLTKGQKFEAVAYIEQDLFSKMSFMTDILSGTVGEIKEEVITEIKTVANDTDYVYYTQEANAEETTFYYSFKNDKIFDVPVGAFRIVVAEGLKGSFNTVKCAWVDEGEDAISMVDAVEEIGISNSFCTGGRNKYNPNVYNYVFKYTYKDNNPRRMVIKVPEVNANTKFTIYIRTGENTYIKQTDFNTQEEYGRQEQYKLSIMPYILDLKEIRGLDNTTDYVSKVLLYSKDFEMQMYYIDSTGKNNAPTVLFTGNVMLVLTKPTLAEQKYFTTKLILLSEYIRGQDGASLYNSFRFHTKMFRSSDQIEYFVSNDPQGRTLNYPLSLEMNTCSTLNNKYYYILNYNKPEEQRNLYLDLIFGSLKSARIVTNLKEEKWDSLVNNMADIKDYFTTIPESSQHIDIVELECNTPLLANIYYNYDNYPYWANQGDVVIKNLNPKESYTFSLDDSSGGSMFYSYEVFNPKENPNIVIHFNNGTNTPVNENMVSSGILFKIPESINVVNNGGSLTRFIFKVGFEVDNSWDKDEANIDGIIYSNGNDKVYKFPVGAKSKNFTDVEILVKPTKIESEPLSENTKFCYSTSLGMPIASSKENCFRTGANIPYTLKFISPFITPKNYKTTSQNYYVTLSPQNNNQYISLTITENRYETKDRNIEGYGKIISLDSEEKKSTILSIPEPISNNRIIVQLQACVSGLQMISYINYNAYTSDVISTGNVSPRERLHYYEINNNIMETRVEFTGANNDKVFVKHAGIKDYEIKLQDYKVTYYGDTNEISIIKPIKSEEFKITVLVGRKNTLNSITLCSFTDKKQSDIEKLADYVKSFSSVSSDDITHYIDFRSFKYKTGEEFDLLVYAVQVKNSKLEFLYEIISGVVGEIKSVFTEIEGEPQSNIVSQKFTKNHTNYLYYDFGNTKPVGNIASLKIVNDGDTSVTISKVICTFINTGATDEEMMNKINLVPQEGTNICKGDEKKQENGYDAIINARSMSNYGEGKARLIIMVQYGFGEKDENDGNENDNKKTETSNDVDLKINLRITGFDVSESDHGYNENEDEALVPYVLDLTKIRGTSAEDYISKVLIYSSKRELEMYHLQSDTPTQLFSGNILLVYTKPEVIKEKYQGATTMILLTESLTKSHDIIIGEQFRFKTYFFKSDNTMNYYVSSNPDGRPINIPTSLEMPSCDTPYYYILNYHYPASGDLTLHIDEIYGQINTKKIATELNKEEWYDLIDSMEEITGEDYLIKQKSKYHMDVIEATCIIPTLLHIYYTDDKAPIISGLGPGDSSIVNIGPTEVKTLGLQLGVMPGFNLVYTFNILSEDREPNIRISFTNSNDDPIIAKNNGIYIKKSEKGFDSISLKNEDIGGSSKTRILFKYGYEIEIKFTPIAKDMYYYNENDNNLFGYKFKTDDDWLDYTSITFLVSTTEDNVKFCYSTNFGSYMTPSMQDCYRVGISNPYPLNILNPYLMYKDYSTSNSNEVLKYYVGFKTVDSELNITITPKLNKYDTKVRNFENVPKSISLTKNNGTILTAPTDNKQYIFLQMYVCEGDGVIDMEFFNAYNNTPLYHKDSIDNNDKVFYRSIENTKLDTELKLTNTISGSAKVFVRYTGIEEEYYPNVEDEFKLEFDSETNMLTINQPIPDEEIKYTIYIDHRGNLAKQNFNLCSIAEKSKLAPYTQTITSKNEKVEVKIDFSSDDLKDYKDYDMVVLAEQVNFGKLMILSDILQQKPKGNDGTNTELIIIIVVLTVVAICGGFVIFFCLKKYKSSPNSKKLDAKQTSLAMVDNDQEKMITSTASEKPE